VLVSDGLFNASLGNVTPLPDVFSANRYLGIRVGNDTEMIPRQSITSVAHAYRVGTVDGATGGTVSGNVTILGKGNIGSTNDNAGSWAFVAGASNTVPGDFSAIGGGRNNAASGDSSIIGGGTANTASNSLTTIGGGMYNQALGSRSTIGGGQYNRARGDYSFVGGGGGATVADTNSASGNYAAIGGGRRIVSSGSNAAVAGGYSNDATGTSCTVSGGSNNAAGSFSYATVSGGQENTASNFGCTVGGGSYNTASGGSATVGGGYGNTASGAGSTVPGGSGNVAGGINSFAGGLYAQVSGNGVFAWADATGDTFGIGASNTFNARASGGVRFWTTSDITQNIGARLPAGGSSWTTLSDSTKKRNLRLVDTKDVLDKVFQMPIKQWSYQSQDPSIEHIGPMAQDFWNLFHVGDDSLSISTIDPGGIALAAIQELAKQNLKLEEELNLLRGRVQTLEADKQETMKKGR
jgi:hypothetical protein